MIAEPFYSSGMHVLVQDGRGDVELLVLYNYEVGEACSVEARFLLARGSELIVREPHLQLMGVDAESEFGIRVDSPTDVVVLVDQSGGFFVALRFFLFKPVFHAPIKNIFF